MFTFIIYITLFEPMMRIELMTSSLPRKCSTTELHRQMRVHVTGMSSYLSGRRGSNPPPEAWKAYALPNELLPHSD